MTVDIAILGLDRVGISIALTLHAKGADFRFRGWDLDPGWRKTADDSGAFQKTTKKAKDCVATANLIILNLAPDALRELLSEIKVNLNENTIFVNISRLHTHPAQIVKETLAGESRFVSLLPVLNPDLLQEPLDGYQDGRADLFNGALAYISAPPSAEARVLDTAVDLAVLLGSLPVFADAREIDGLTAANLMLPEMTACALMNAISLQPSWREGGTIAGTELASVSMTLNGINPMSTSQTMYANRENNLRLLDDLIAQLYQLKDRMQEGDQKKLEAYLENSRKAHEDWLEKRNRAGELSNATSSIPTAKYALERLLKLGS